MIVASEPETLKENGTMTITIDTSDRDSLVAAEKRAELACRADIDSLDLYAVYCHAAAARRAYDREHQGARS